MVKNFLLKIIAPVLLIVVWQVAASAGWLNQNILPSPVKVVIAFADMVADGRLQRNIVISLFRVLKGFLAGAAVGITLGTFMGISPNLNKILSSLVSIFRPIPMIAWIPLLILWLGIGEQTKVAVIFIGALWPMLLNTISGILSVDVKLLQVAQIMEKSRPQILFRVVIPAAMPSVFTGIRLGISTSWTCVVAAEMFAASSGVGYMIMYARELSRPDIVLVGVFVIGIVGLLIDFGITRLQNWVLRWNAVPGTK